MSFCKVEKGREGEREGERERGREGERDNYHAICITIIIYTITSL